MVEAIQNFFSQLFGNNAILATILIAMVPIIEVKGAIPFGMSQALFGVHALGSFPAFLYALLGSSIIVPLLAIIYKPVINWLKGTKLFRKIGEKIENRVNARKEKIGDKISQLNSADEKKRKRNITVIKILGVFSFVALPLPFTGVWTGTCLAVALGLSFTTICLVVIIANAISGLLVTFLSGILGTKVMLIALLVILGIFILAMITRKTLNKILDKHAKQQTDDNYIPNNQAENCDIAENQE